MPSFKMITMTSCFKYLSLSHVPGLWCFVKVNWVRASANSSSYSWDNKLVQIKYSLHTMFLNKIVFDRV